MPRSYVPQRVAARIRRARTDAHLTQGQLGEACGVGNAAVCSWESGRTQPPIGAMYAICNVCGVQMGWLTGWDNDRKGE